MVPINMWSLWPSVAKEEDFKTKIYCMAPRRNPNWTAVSQSEFQISNGFKFNVDL